MGGLPYLDVENECGVTFHPNVLQATVEWLLAPFFVACLIDWGFDRGQAFESDSNETFALQHFLCSTLYKTMVTSSNQSMRNLKSMFSTISSVMLARVLIFIVMIIPNWSQADQESPFFADPVISIKGKGFEIAPRAVDIISHFDRYHRALAREYAEQSFGKNTTRYPTAQHYNKAASETLRIFKPFGKEGENRVFYKMSCRAYQPNHIIMNLAFDDEFVFLNSASRGNFVPDELKLNDFVMENVVSLVWKHCPDTLSVDVYLIEKSKAEKSSNGFITGAPIAIMSITFDDELSDYRTKPDFYFRMVQ